MAPHKANAITITDQALWASRVREEGDVVTPDLPENPSLLKKPDGVGLLQEPAEAVSFQEQASV